MGWRFTASENKKLRPKKFWGISRRSILPSVTVKVSDKAEDEDEV